MIVFGSHASEQQRHTAALQPQRQLVEPNCARLVDGADPPYVEHEHADIGRQRIDFTEQAFDVGEDERVVELEHVDAGPERPQQPFVGRRAGTP